MAAASLVVRVSAQIAEFQKSFNDATKVAQKFSEDFEGIATRAATVGTFFGTIAADIASSLARAFAGGVADAVRLSSEFSNAFIGLGSVARAFGTEADAAKDAAKRLSSDGLLPLKDSATGLKNLLATGFSLDQSIKLMDTFKDSAAFGRAGALSFGDAVRTATEGIKNGNSILVDNAGITKNLSQILKEAGYSAQDLSRASSDAGVRMALLNGVVKEGAAFLGDANRLTQTYSGTLTAMRTQWENLLATWGDAITQNKVVQEALAFTGDAFRRLAVFLSDNDRGFKLVSDAVIGFVGVVTAGVRALNFFQQAFNLLDTAVISTVKVFVDASKIISDTVLSIATFASKLPGSTLVLSAFKEELFSTAVISVEAGKAADRLGARIEENTERSKTWGDALNGFAGSLDGLKTRLEAARGKVVEFGSSGNQAGAAFAEGLGKGMSKAEKAMADSMQRIKKISHDAIHQMMEEQTRRLKLGFDEYVSELLIHLQGVRQAEKESREAVWEMQSDLSKRLRAQFAEDVAIQVRELQRLRDVADNALRSLGSAFDELGRIAGGAFGQILEGFGLFTGAIDRAKGAMGAFKDGLSIFKSGEALAGIAGMASGILGIVSAAGLAVSAIKGIFSALDRNKGRDTVEDFADTFGGFDALHKELHTLGEEGERLWIALTQGVGRNNPEQARRVIDEITQAFAKQDAAREAATVATEAGAQATIETAAQASVALDELNVKIADNITAWGAWSVAVTGYLQGLADNIRALPMVAPGGGFSGGGAITAPQVSYAGGGGGAVPTIASFAPAEPSSGTTTAIIQMDGLTVTEVVVPHIPGVVRRYGLA